MKVVGVMTEFGVFASSFRGRSKYEFPSIVKGRSPRERVWSVLQSPDCLVMVEFLACSSTRRSLRGPILATKSVMLPAA
jgi:hypothetical protein